MKLIIPFIMVCLFGYGVKIVRQVPLNPQAVELIEFGNNDPDPKIVYLFSHGTDPRAGIACIQAQRYIDAGLIQGKCYTFAYCDAINTINFAQDRDLQLLMMAYHAVREKHLDAKIILIGLSRGASVILPFLATQPNVAHYVQAVILESPFNDVPTLLEHIGKNYLWMIPKKNKLLNTVIRVFPQYDPYARSPMSYISDISPRIPFFIVYSCADKVVPFHGVQQIINEFTQRGNVVDALQLTLGGHSLAYKQPIVKQRIDAFYSLYVK